jgi:osmotically inducible lipoprotein OsmB
MKQAILTMFLSSTLLIGCSGAGRDTLLGAGTGAGAGAAIGHATGGHAAEGAAIGGAVGAASGYGIHEMHEHNDDDE